MPITHFTIDLVPRAHISQKPGSQLAFFLKKNGITQLEFSRRLSPIVSVGLVSNWIYGYRRPSPKYREQVRALTNGAVEVDLWISDREARRAAWIAEHPEGSGT